MAGFSSRSRQAGRQASKEREDEDETEAAVAVAVVGLARRLARIDQLDRPVPRAPATDRPTRSNQTRIRILVRRGGKRVRGGEGTIKDAGGIKKGIHFARSGKEASESSRIVDSVRNERERVTGVHIIRYSCMKKFDRAGGRDGRTCG